MEFRDDAALKPALHGDDARHFPTDGHVVPRTLNINNRFICMRGDAFVGYFKVGIGIGFLHKIDTAIYICRRPRWLRLGTV